LERRLRTALSVYLFGIAGAFLLFAPWSALWDEGTRFLVPTGVGAWIRSNWARGAVSGIGLLDLFVAAREARALWLALRHRGDAAGGADGGA
jgi:hypothetical protein